MDAERAKLECKYNIVIMKIMSYSSWKETQACFSVNSSDLAKSVSIIARASHPTTTSLLCRFYPNE